MLSLLLNFPQTPSGFPTTVLLGKQLTFIKKRNQNLSEDFTFGAFNIK
jgi:hypothetical protein